MILAWLCTDGCSGSENILLFVGIAGPYIAGLLMLVGLPWLVWRLIKKTYTKKDTNETRYWRKK